MALSAKTGEELRNYVQMKMQELGGPLEFLEWLSITTTQKNFLLGDFKAHQVAAYDASISDSNAAKTRLGTDIP